MIMIPLWRTALRPRPNFASWKSQRTRRLIPIVKCAYISYHTFDAYNPRRRLKRLMYYQRYYEGGVSSVYLWDLEDGGFAGVVLLKKSACQSP
jgi:hypothetical protein